MRKVLAPLLLFIAAAAFADSADLAVRFYFVNTPNRPGRTSYFGIAVENALGAEVMEKYEHEGAIVHAKVRAGASVVELGEAHGEWQPIPMMLVVAVDDLDDAFGRAVAAGGKVLQPPSKQPYGRRGAVEDPFGNQWHFMSEA